MFYILLSYTKGFTVNLAKLHFYLAQNTLLLYWYQWIISFIIFNVLVFWLGILQNRPDQIRHHMKLNFDLFQLCKWLLELQRKIKKQDHLSSFIGSPCVLWSKMTTILMVTKIQVTRCKSEYRIWEIPLHAKLNGFTELNGLRVFLKENNFFAWTSIFLA